MRLSVARESREYADQVDIMIIGNEGEILLTW